MSLSPTREDPGDRGAYEAGFEALHRLMREGSSFSGHERHAVFSRTGDGPFVDVGHLLGLDFPDDGRAAAALDWDGDGRTDLLLTGRQAPRVRLLLNRVEDAGETVSLRLEGAGAWRDAIGARVTMRAGGRELVRTLRAGEGYLAQSSKWLRFGLGRAASIEALRVRWPDGSAEDFQGAEPGGRYVLRRGRGSVQPVPRPAFDVAPSEAAPAPAAAPPSERARIPLAARLPLPTLRVSTHDGRLEAWGGRRERPYLVHVWASWCAPCLAELRALTAGADDLDAAGLDVVLISGDEPSERESSVAILRDLRVPFPAGHVAGADLEALDVLQRAALDRKRRMAVPTSFLVDTEGRVAVIYRGPTEVAGLVADVARLRASPTEMRDAAVPFPGRWRAAPVAADLAALEAALEERGLDAASRELSLRRIETRETSRAEVLNEFGTTRARQGDLAGAIEQFRAAVAEDPRLVDARTNLAAALHQTGAVPAAIAQYREALRLDPKREDTRFNLALALAAEGDRAGFEAELAELEVLAPELARRLRETVRR